MVPAGGVAQAVRWRKGHEGVAQEVRRRKGHGGVVQAMRWRKAHGGHGTGSEMEKSAWGAWHRQ